jgi:hypothetical protein
VGEEGWVLMSWSHSIFIHQPKATTEKSKCNNKKRVLEFYLAS